MFKIISRILVILLVAAIVSGGLYALVQSGSAGSTETFPPDRQFEGRTFDRNPDGTITPPDRFREHESESEFSIGHGLAGMLGTLLKIGVVTLLVLLVQKMLAKSPRRAQSGSA
jgi:hypothetical protein